MQSSKNTAIWALRGWEEISIHAHQYMQVTATYGTATHNPTVPPPYAKRAVAYDHKTSPAGNSTYQPMPPHVPTNYHITSAPPPGPSIIPASHTQSQNQPGQPKDPPPYQE